MKKSSQKFDKFYTKIYNVYRFIFFVQNHMATIDQKMKEFQSKSYEEKLKISMNIITNLKDRGNTQAQEIYDRISVMEKIPENVVDAIYKDFCDSVERIQQEKVQWELHQFDKAKEYMQKLREEEKRQREEENCEWLLDWLDDL